MIHILFVTGSFGSMLEWGIRSYASQYQDPVMGVNPDGSMHVHKKLCHPLVFKELEYINEINDPMCITTPIHPMIDCHSDKVINFFNKEKFTKDKKILIDVPDTRTAELIILMQYYKISIGLDQTLNSIFNNDVCKHNITRWNLNYKHWNEMELWELREWFSLFYIEWVTEWITAKDHINDSWLLVNPIELVNNYKSVIKQTIEFCNLTYVDNVYSDNTSTEWVTKQLPIIRQIELIDQIVSSTIETKPFGWEPLTVLHEAMIQRRLRDYGYELKCYKLNDFPTNTTELNRLLEK